MSVIQKLLFGFITLFVLVGLPNIAHATNTAPTEKIRLQLKWFNQFQFAGYYAAVEQGYYADEGLEVEIVERDINKSIVEQVVSGESEYGIGDAGLVSEYIKGKPIVALAAIFQHNPLIYMALEDSGIISPYEMVGKRIMADSLSANEGPLNAMLAAGNVTRKDYTLLKQSGDYSLLTRGKTDVISGYLTDQPFYFKQQGININVINPRSYGIDFYGDFIFTSQAELQNHPHRADKFLKASLKGWRYALEHPEELIKIIKVKYHSQLSLKHLRFESEETRKLILPDAIPVGQITLNRLRVISDSYTAPEPSKVLTDYELSAFVYAHDENESSLTHEEQSWLDRNRIIDVGVSNDFAPYEWIDKNGNYVGMVADYLTLIEKKLGVHFKKSEGEYWSKTLSMAKSGQLDMLSAATLTPERAKDLIFLKPYKFAPVVIIDNGDGPFIGELNNLKGKRVAVEKGYFMEELLRTNHPLLNIVLTNSTKEALTLVSEGKADAYVGDAGSTNYLMNHYGLLSLRFSGQTPYLSQQAIAVHNSNPLLASILSKTLNEIPQKQIDEVFNRWLGLKIEQGVNQKTVLKYGFGILILLLLFLWWILRLHKEVEARKRAELLERSRAYVLELITTGEPLPVILEGIVHSVEELDEQTLCSILILDETGEHLLHGAAPNLPDFYNEAIHGMDIGPEAGSCGSAAFTNKRIIVKDVQNHPYWELFKELAAKAELGSCWSQPIRSTKNRVLGTFAIYHRDPHSPNEYDIALIEQAASLASIAIEQAQSHVALKNKELRFHKFLQHIPSVAVQGYDSDGKTTYWNKASEKLYGYTSEEALGQSLYDLIIPPAMHAHVKDAMQLMLESGHAIPSGEVTLRVKDGTEVNVFSSHAYVHIPGQPPEMFCLDVDLTERKQAEERLKLAATVFSHAREGIMITDASGNIIEINKTFSDITGYSREDVIGQNPRMLQSGGQSPEFYAEMWASLLEKEHWKGEVWNRRKSGEVYAELLTISTVHNAAGQVHNYVALFTDITQMKEHQGQLEHIAHYDVLTNLPNRVLLSDRLSQAMVQCQRHQQSLAVAFLDLDGFKAVNDTHGHNIGDELLITLSKRMKEALREGDTLARIGGDEFIAVLADLTKVEDCQPVLERLLQAAATPITVGDAVLHVSASIGVTIYPQDNVETDELMRHADQAMYVAKQGGKNRYHLFDTAQDEAVKIQHESLANIRLAIERREFVLYYQPKVNMQTGDIIGVEALIRWQHPSLGLLPPAAFLPVIEDHDISLDVGEWVVDTALIQISQWQSMGVHLPISVNISAYQLQQDNFITCLTALLATHPDVNPSHLELEVLETSALSDISQVSATMKACSNLGIGFALDDFGTGYSSLTYLRRLPANLIKIDQSFIRDMLIDSDDLAIVEGVIGLAKSFKREVIAEGVETVEHGTALLELGCELAQGYGIARPMPASDIPTWITNWKPDEAWQAE